MNLVVYHGNCNDGFCAAWLWSKIHPNDEFIQGYYGAVVDVEKFKDRKVVMLDFAYKRHDLDKILEVAESVLIIDHHKTADIHFEHPKLKVIFDLKESGASLTHRYLCELEQENVNKLKHAWVVPYVKDRDLWKWEYPFTKEINAYLARLPHEFAAWDTIDFAQAYREGKVIYNYQCDTARAQAKKAVTRMLCDYEVPILNCTYLISETLEILAQNAPFSASFFIRNDGVVQWSLRSTGFDVSEIAKRFGGGGHTQAAGFETDLAHLKSVLG